jgi:Flp pilus assembly protein CpaB
MKRTLLIGLIAAVAICGALAMLAAKVDEFSPRGADDDLAPWAKTQLEKEVRQ